MSTVPLVELQAESARTNELVGVLAFLTGVLAEIERAPTLAAAKTLVEMAQQMIAEWHAGIWKPGSNDDPADWMTLTALATNGGDDE